MKVSDVPKGTPAIGCFRCDIMVGMTEDEELQELEAWPNEAQRMAAVAAFEAFEEEWWREREERQSTRGAKAESRASSPPLSRARKRVP